MFVAGAMLVGVDVVRDSFLGAEAPVAMGLQVVESAARFAQTGDGREQQRPTRDFRGDLNAGLK